MVKFLTLNSPNYYATFFGARTDMKTLYHQIEAEDDIKNVHNEQLIVKKR